jgi:hypothetical protein
MGVARSRCVAKQHIGFQAELSEMFSDTFDRIDVGQSRSLPMRARAKPESLPWTGNPKWRRFHPATLLRSGNRRGCKLQSRNSSN